MGKWKKLQRKFEIFHFWNLKWKKMKILAFKIWNENLEIFIFEFWNNFFKFEMKKN
jgi:hypothetical protein